MITPPPTSTPTEPLCPYTAPGRSTTDESGVPQPVYQAGCTVRFHDQPFGHETHRCGFMRRADRQQCLVLARRQSRLGGLAFAECRELTQRIAKAGQRLIIGVSKGLVVVHGISHTARQRLKNVAVRYKRHAIPNKG